MTREEFIGKLQMCYFGERNAFNEIVSEYDKLKGALQTHEILLKTNVEEIDRLNNIITELEKWCNNGIKNGIHIAYEQELDYEDVLDKLKELKEDNK